MKKIIALVLAVMMICLLVACTEKSVSFDTPVVSDGTISPTATTMPTDTPAADPDAGLKALLIGGWTQTNGEFETAAVPNVVEFAADSSLVYYGYESIASGIYAVNDGQVTLKFTHGRSEGVDYDMTEEDNMVGTYDDASEILTLKKQSGTTDHVITFEKTA